MKYERGGVKIERFIAGSLSDGMASLTSSKGVIGERSRILPEGVVGRIYPSGT